MNEPDLFILADRTLESVVAQIREDQWEQPQPGEFMRRREGIPTLREIVNAHAYDDAWVPAMLAGRTMDEVGRTKFDGDLLGADPKSAFGALVNSACTAASSCADLDLTVHCSFGDFSAREYFWQITMYRGLRAHDMASAIGIEQPMPDDLVSGLWEQISPQAERWRAIGVFPARVEVPDDAPLLDRLLGLTGRTPSER